MRPLIVSATRDEIAESIPFLESNSIPYLITGVGMVETTYSLTKYLASQDCDYIINLGIAGSFDKSISLGSVVEIDIDIFSELGAEDDNKFLSITELGFGQTVYQKINHLDIKTDLPSFNGITVNKVHGSEASIYNVKNLFPNISIESMEGAAVFYVASQFNVPSIQVRAISNYVEKRDKSTWNIPLSIKNLNNWLLSYLKKDH